MVIIHIFYPRAKNVSNIEWNVFTHRENRKHGNYSVVTRPVFIILKTFIMIKRLNTKYLVNNKYLKHNFFL